MPEPGRSGRRHVLTITRGKTTAGRKVYIGGGKRTYGALRKTTRKGAYKKRNKQAFAIRRRPFVETKRQTDEILAGKNGEITGAVKDGIRNPVVPLELTNGTNTPGGEEELNFLPVHTFLSMNKGFEGSDMIGQSVYSRFLQARLEFELPSGSNQIQHPCNIYLIHGWVTAPKNNTQHTPTTISGQLRTDLQDYIKQHITEHFNQRRDKLQWIPKRTSSLKILGYRKIKPKTNNNLGIDSTMLNNPNAGGIQTYSVGSKPLINMTCNWPMKRKVHYVQGASASGSVEHQYPNYSWLPFMIVFNPTAGDFFNTTLYPSGDPKLKVRYNCIHYYTDS